MVRSGLILIGVAGAVALAAALLTLANYGNEPTTALTSTTDVIVVTNFQKDHGFVRQSRAGEQLDDAGEYALGNQSLKMMTEGNSAPVFTRKELVQSLNFTDRVLKVWLKVQGVDNVRELRVSTTGDDFRTWSDYWIVGPGARADFLPESMWTAVTVSPAQATVMGEPDISRVDSVQVRVVDRGTGEPVTVWVSSVALLPRNERPVITFVFDDGYETDYSGARPVLDKYHFPATSYVIGTMVGTSGRLSVQQLKSLQDINGWDIASHSYTHSNLTERARPEIEDDLALSKEFLERNGLYQGSDHFAYPYGEFDSEELRALVQKYFSTARTSHGPIETLPPSDPYRLRVMAVSNTTSPEEVSQRVQAAIAGGDWLILVFHRIVDSDADAATKYLRQDFEQIVDDVASRGVDVLTISQVYADRFR
jgi:peptidoglycan/xylan/chitin deacetylase (PgdA/CDA1 family)